MNTCKLMTRSSNGAAVYHECYPVAHGFALLSTSGDADQPVISRV